MASNSTAHTAVGASAGILIKWGESYTYVVTGTFVATWQIETSNNGGASWNVIASGTGTQTSVQMQNNDSSRSDVLLRSNCTAFTSGTMTVVVADVTGDRVGGSLTDSAGTIQIEYTDDGINIPGNLSVAGTQTVTGDQTFTGILTADGGITATTDVDISPTEALTGSVTDEMDFTAGTYISLAGGTGDSTLSSTSGNVILGAASTGNSVRVNGGLQLDVLDTAVTASSDYKSIVNVTDTSSARTITLEADENLDGKIHIVKDSGGQAGTNAITVTPESGTIDGAASVTINTNYGHLAMFSDGTNYHTLNNQSWDPGTVAVNVLRVANDVVSAETVTIGADVYEVEIVNTDSTDDTANSDFANTTDPLTVTDAVTNYSNSTFSTGSLHRIESEIMRVTGVAGNDVTFQRGVSGTTTASHADANDIYEGDGIAGGSTVAVGLVATLTPTAFTPALVDDINSEATETVTASQVSVNEMLLVYDSTGANTTACTEGLTGVNNEWEAANMYGGKAASPRKTVIQSRVPQDGEVALGNMHFAFDFTPVYVEVRVVVTATPGIALAWDGAATISGTTVVLDNSGAADWATTNTVYIRVTD